MVSFSHTVQPGLFSFLGAAASLALMAPSAPAAPSAETIELAQSPVILAQVSVDSLGLGITAGETLLADAEAAIDAQD